MRAEWEKKAFGKGAYVMLHPLCYIRPIGPVTPQGVRFLIALAPILALIAWVQKDTMSMIWLVALAVMALLAVLSFFVPSLG